MYKLLISLLLKLDNLTYKLISIFIVKAHKGIHPKHEILKYHDFFTKNINTNDKILDIGCGNGALAHDLAKKAKHVTGIDISDKNIRFAKSKFKSPNIKYINGDATTYNFQQNFDVVVLSNVLEHIDDRQIFLKKIKKLAPSFLIRVPMVTRDWLAMYKKQQGVEYRLDPGHKTEYSIENFQKEISQVGLKIKNYSVQYGEIWAIIEK